MATTRPTTRPSRRAIRNSASACSKKGYRDLSNRFLRSLRKGGHFIKCGLGFLGSALGGRVSPRRSIRAPDKSGHARPSMIGHASFTGRLLGFIIPIYKGGLSRSGTATVVDRDSPLTVQPNLRLISDYRCIHVLIV